MRRRSNDPVNPGRKGPAAQRPWGFPRDCPVCATPGFLDYIDLLNRVTREHCPHCQARWEVNEDECAPA